MSETFKANAIEAEAEAKRFLARLKAWRLAGNMDSYIMGCKHRGAVKRASMDLTRSLAKLRKGNAR